MPRNPISASRNSWKIFGGLFFLGLLFASQTGIARAQTIARCGDGWLEKIDGYPVLHVKGTAYEMGYQHGSCSRNRLARTCTISSAFSTPRRFTSGR